MSLRRSLSTWLRGAGGTAGVPSARWLAPAALTVAVVACAPSLGRPPVPTAERVIPVPPGGESVVEPRALSHVLRGLLSLATGHPAAAVTDLRLALAYAPESPFVHERLALAWSVSGHLDRGRAVLVQGLSRAPQAPGLNLLAGELAVAEGRHADARGHLALAVADADLLVRAAPVYVDARLWIERSQVVEADAQALAARLPVDASLALGLAGALEDHGRLDAALELYRGARRQRPASEGAAFGEARLLSLAGRFEEAADSLVPLLRFYPDQGEYLIEIARLLRLANSPEAAAYREEALRQSRLDPEGRLRVAAGDLVAGDLAKGLRTLRDVIRQWPAHGPARLFLAQTLFHAGEGAGCLEVLAPLEGGGAALPRARGECRAMVGDMPTALAELEAAVRAGSARDELLAAAGTLARYGGDKAAAGELVRDLTARVSTLVTPKDAVLAEAAVLDHFGDVEALALVERLWTEAPTDPELTLRWADLASRYGKRAAGLAALERLVRGGPQGAVLLNALGFTLADAGVRLDEAEVWLRRAHRLAPDQGFIVDSLGWLLYRRGDRAGARRLLEQATGLNPGDPEILRHLGEVYDALGRAGDARSCYERALSHRPAAPLRRLLEGLLRGRSA